MNLSQRNRNIILWIIAIGLLISMVISFTPGSLFGGASQEDAAEGPVALNVNGEPIRELEISRLEQNPPFNAVQEGPVARDLERVLLDELVSQSLVKQAAADVSVSSTEVRDRVNEFRDAQGVAGSRNDRGYQNLIAGAGYTDETFRELTREQLQQEKYLDSLSEGLTVSDEETKTYYAANPDAYSSEPRITAREIVVADKKQADLVYARALAGEDFAALARETSSERAEQAGALGAAKGESAPQPVTRVALPTAVAEAAFTLQGPGLTAPVEAGSAFHIVKVESYQPAAPRPLDEVRDEVSADVLELKKAAVKENTLRELKANAEVTAPEGSSYRYDNEVVARVGDYEIKAAELDRNTYLNPQLQQLITPDFADIIATSVRPNVLNQLIDEELAYQGAGKLDATFAGPRSAVAQSALGYVSRDARATDAQIRTFYKNNDANYTEPPSALTTRVTFPDAESGRNFRTALLGADTVDAEVISVAADAAGGTVQDLGNVLPGAQAEAIDTALFNFENGMEAVGKSGFDVSRVLALTPPAPDAPSGGSLSGGGSSGGAGGAVGATPPSREHVVLVAARTPERVRPLAEVRPQVERAATQQQRTQAQQTWLEGLRKDIPVENLLAAEIAAAAQRDRAQSGGAQSGGTQGGEADGDAGPVLTPTTPTPPTTTPPTTAPPTTAPPTTTPPTTAPPTTTPPTTTPPTTTPPTTTPPTTTSPEPEPEDNAN